MLAPASHEEVDGLQIVEVEVEGEVVNAEIEALDPRSSPGQIHPSTGLAATTAYAGRGVRSVMSAGSGARRERGVAGKEGQRRGVLRAESIIIKETKEGDARVRGTQ
jgi:hypothetical protein